MDPLQRVRQRLVCCHREYEALRLYVLTGFARATKAGDTLVREYVLDLTSEVFDSLDQCLRPWWRCRPRDQVGYRRRRRGGRRCTRGGWRATRARR